MKTIKLMLALALLVSSTPLANQPSCLEHHYNRQQMINLMKSVLHRDELFEQMRLNRFSRDQSLIAYEHLHQSYNIELAFLSEDSMELGDRLNRAWYRYLDKKNQYERTQMMFFLISNNLIEQSRGLYQCAAIAFNIEQGSK